ncbi:hypothetical protein LY90DRAFT_513451 [Neocallimastix californiae]|uniref:G-protein coupled receptors family 3 profile domain-containing protein n=1 Tax=Neocallimastix californiae TaxID=1754190 RepID=A0A1Y2AZW6_9FUNG|nr:hypothetical protein LY90DRAFT_513451 [Neocallimastix californiae]|eukprot:ORY27405.1 hypothetical protein LY90DRAFT_513451 [Neocallimastix californiae]
MQYGMEEKFIFIKFVDYDDFTKYTKSLLPGHKKGISGSFIGGYNIGINKYSNENKRDSIIETYKFLTSKNMQENLLKKYNIDTGITSLYDDEEICKNKECEILKSIQTVRRPNHVSLDYDIYSKNIRNYIYEFLFGNKTTDEVLKKVEDITKIYKISIYGDNVTLALIFNMSFSFIIIFMAISLIMLYFNRYKSYFNFLSDDFWLIMIIGMIFVICPGILENGTRTILKCELSLLFLMIGSTFILIPILHKLVVNFPTENKFTIWISNHKFTFLLIFTSIDILHLLLLPFFYTIKLVEPKEMEKFEICQLKKDNIIIEWNLKRTYNDLRFIVLAIYTNILFLILIIIIKSVNNTNYINQYINNTFLYLIVALLNYIIIYFSRIIKVLLKKDNDEILFIKNINKQFISNESSILNNDSTEKNQFRDQRITTNDIKNISNKDIDSNINKYKRKYSVIPSDTVKTIIKILYDHHNTIETSNCNTSGSSSSINENSYH